jgi:hypothetical protein
VQITEQSDFQNLVILHLYSGATLGQAFTIFLQKHFSTATYREQSYCSWVSSGARLGHDRFLPNIFQLINRLIIRRYTVLIVRASWNNQLKNETFCISHNIIRHILGWIFLLTASCLACFSTLKLEVICSSKESGNLHRTTRRYVPEDRTCHVLTLNAAFENRCNPAIEK